MASKLFVGGLPYATTSDELNELFASYGSIVSATVVTDRDTGRSKGFGFVEFSSDDEAKAAIDGLNNSEVGGRRIIVNEARPQEKRPPRDNGGFGGNRY
jgi:RNA recognition motif-containing protein